MKTASLLAVPILSLTLCSAPAVGQVEVLPPAAFGVPAVFLPSGPELNGLVLCDVKLRNRDGNWFLVGTELGPAGTAGLPHWVPMKDVRIQIAFTTPAAPVQTSRREASDDITDWDSLGMRIPIDYDSTRRAGIESLKLFVSADRGKTWVGHTEANPDEDHFRFLARREGEYWFCLQVISKTGTKEPADGAMTPALKVRMRDVRPTVPMPKARD